MSVFRFCFPLPAVLLANIACVVVFCCHSIAAEQPPKQAIRCSVVESPGTALRPTKPFGIEYRNGIAWLTRPTGERFFSFGVSCVGMGPSRQEYDPKKPEYAAWRHYPDAAEWSQTVLKRMHSWGFTTVGGWSDFENIKKCSDPNVGFAPVLHIGSTAGAPWRDMWDPNIMERMDQVARDQILPLRDDPRVIGYYTDNEMGWWNATLFTMTLEQPATSGQRLRLIELLEQTYHHDWNQLLKDFIAEGPTSWDELKQKGTLHLRPGGNGIRTMRTFLGLMAERYYSLVRHIIRKYDKRALVMGDRYQSFYYPEVARASAPYVDVVSTNLNASWNDGTYPRFYLDTLHTLTRKPIIVSEFYMSASENRSGNQNNHGIFPVVATQAERATGFRTTLHFLLKDPNVVGADWFQYYDEPTHGRDDGENFNFGLVDINDQPYELLTRAMAATDLIALKDHASSTRPDASEGVPPAPRDPMGQFKPTLALKDWDRARGFVRPASEAPMADLYLAWSEKAIYVGLYAQDVVEDAYYRDKVVPADERAHWTITIVSAKKEIHSRIGAGVEPSVDEPDARVVNVSGLMWNVRNIAAMELPAKLFGKERFKPGDKIELSSTFLAHGRGYSNDWRGSFTLAE